MVKTQTNLFDLCLLLVGNAITIAESLQFNFPTIQAATNNFSDDNKLGEGGFGDVYKVMYFHNLLMTFLNKNGAKGENVCILDLVVFL